jgi:hypothetical protein
MSIVYELKRLIKNKPEYTVSFTQSDIEMIYDALNEYGYEDIDDDNQPSVIMNKLYNMIEV